MISFKYGELEIIAWEFEVLAGGKMTGSFIARVVVNQVGDLSPKTCAELCVVYLEHAPSFQNHFDITDVEIKIEKIMFCKDSYWVIASATGKDQTFEEFDPTSVYEDRSA